MISVGTGERFRIMSVRYKTRYRFTDGDLKVIIEHVRQKDAGSSPKNRWELEVLSHHLKKTLQTL